MRLLLAEDERSLSRALTAILEGNYYAVDAVYNGKDALSYLDSGNYDAVILDIMMPKMDGLEVLRRLRSRGSQIPVLLLTAKGEVEDKVFGLDCGANDYLSKPFAAQELLARIRAMTRTRTMQENTVIRMGNLVLDRTSFELSTPYGTERLPNKQYQMLELLMRNPDILISAERFIEVIWGLDSNTDISAVRVHISCLRKIITELHGDVQIVAKRNAGYCLGER